MENRTLHRVLQSRIVLGYLCQNNLYRGSWGEKKQQEPFLTIIFKIKVQYFNNTRWTLFTFLSVVHLKLIDSLLMQLR